MRSYYIKYILLFLVNVILIDAIIFITSDKKEVDISSLMILGHAIQIPLEQGDISKVNNIIDTYPEKIIIEREGIIYTSNFAKDQIDRTGLANGQMEKYQGFWRSLPIFSETVAEKIYYKNPEINYFNKILMDTLFSLLLGLCITPLMIIVFRDISSLYYSIEHLRQYLEATRDQLENIKHNKISDEFDKSKDKEKLQKRLADSKNKRIMLQSELDKIQHDYEKRVNDIESLKETIANLKSDLQNSKIDRNRIEDAKNNAIKDKQEITAKLRANEEELKNKNIDIERSELKLKELNGVITQISEHLRLREKEIEKLKTSKASPIEITQLKEKIAEAERENTSITNDIRDLLEKLDLKDNHINTLKENVSQLSLDRIKLQNEINNLKTKNNSEHDIVDALVKENNELKDIIMKLNDEVKNKSLTNTNIQSGAYLDAEYNRLNVLLKDKESQVHLLSQELKQKENELKEFTLDTLDKLSALNRYEAQITDMTRELRQKDSLIESVNSRIDVKDQIINTLNNEMNQLKEKLDKVTIEEKATRQILSDI